MNIRPSISKEAFEEAIKQRLSAKDVDYIMGLFVEVDE